MDSQTLPLPTHRQFILSTVALLLLNLAISPITGLFIAIASALRNVGGRTVQYDGIQSKTVMINGAKMYKSLGMIRALGRAGCRVVLVEQGIDGKFSGARFSKYVSKYYTVPLVIPGKTETSEAYVRALVKIAKDEKVDLFIPCSGAGTTIDDAIAAEKMSEKHGGSTKSVITSPELTKVLHEKDLFMDLLKELDVLRPMSKLVKSPAEALDFIKSTRMPMIIKATAVLDDLGRNDMTQYPLHNDVAPDFPATRKRLESGLSIPITAKTPYIVQQFIQGDEWCTHATVIDNKLLALVCCPSNDMLMLYEDWTLSAVGQLARKWTENFLEAWKKSDRGRKEPFTGHFSMDFIRHSDDRMYPIECNPRVHTAICLLADNDTDDFAKVYIEPNSVSKVLTPQPKTSPRSWLGHDLPALVLPSLVPFLGTLHPYAQRQTPRRLNFDPTFDRHDPLPFFAFYHIQWPFLLLKQLFARRKRWVRINVSTSRIFEAS